MARRINLAIGLGELNGGAADKGMYHVERRNRRSDSSTVCSNMPKDGQNSLEERYRRSTAHFSYIKQPCPHIKPN